MSGVSLPVTRPTGRCLVVGLPACRSAPVAGAQREGLICTEVDDPYDAMVQLCRRPLFYTAMILSLNSLYREELQIISSIKRKFAHIEIWLSDTDGRQAALAEAMRLGADGLLAGDGLHRIGPGIPPPEPAMPELPGALDEPSMRPSESYDDAGPMRHSDLDRSPDPILTAEELRALLQDHPVTPGTGE